MPSSWAERVVSHPQGIARILMSSVARARCAKRIAVIPVLGNRYPLSLRHYLAVQDSNRDKTLVMVQAIDPSRVDGTGNTTRGCGSLPAC
jgi:hypothetical protein